MLATVESSETVAAAGESPNSDVVCVNISGAGLPPVCPMCRPADLNETLASYFVTSSPAVNLAGWVLVLCATQMLMLVYGKKATSDAPLPLALCFVQFATSALFAGAICAMRTGRLPWSPRELWPTITSLAAVWTAGFVLFNASAAVMSPSLVSVVRCMEPLATIVLGFAVGERYSAPTLATLLPICGGVALASVRATPLGIPPLDILMMILRVV
jgi:drug/metabolite transporter (DMT)-like permease